MSYAERHTVQVQTASDGSVTAHTDIVTGEIVNISYVKASSDAFADTVDFAVTLETSGVGLWTEANVTASKTVAPTQAAHDQAGAGVTFDGTRPVRRPIVAAGERVQIAVTNGGASKNGTFVVVVA